MDTTTLTAAARRFLARFSATLDAGGYLTQRSKPARKSAHILELVRAGLIVVRPYYNGEIIITRA